MMSDEEEFKYSSHIKVNNVSLTIEDEVSQRFIDQKEFSLHDSKANMLLSPEVHKKNTTQTKKLSSDFKNQIN